MFRRWRWEDGLQISLEEWKKAGFPVAHYPAHITRLVIGKKK